MFNDQKSYLEIKLCKQSFDRRIVVPVLNKVVYTSWHSRKSPSEIFQRDIRLVVVLVRLVNRDSRWVNQLHISFELAYPNASAVCARIWEEILRGMRKVRRVLFKCSLKRKGYEKKGTTSNLFIHSQLAWIQRRTYTHDYLFVADWLQTYRTQYWKNKYTVWREDDTNWWG